MSLSAQITLLATRIGNTLRDTVMPRVQPAGGTTGQVLTKTSAVNYASAWQTPATGSNGVVAGTKTLTYTGGVLTSVAGPAGATKALSYTSGSLTQVQSIVNGVTTTKTLGYTSGALSSVSTVIS